MLVQYEFDVFGIDVFAGRAENHVFRSALEGKPAVFVETAEVAGTEPAVGREDGRSEGRILVVAFHDHATANGNLADTGGGIALEQLHFDAGHCRTDGTDLGNFWTGTGQKRRSFGKTVADGVREAGREQKLLHVDAEKLDAAAERLFERLARNAVQDFAEDRNSIQFFYEWFGGKQRDDLVLVNLFHDDRNALDEGRPVFDEGRHEDADRRRFFQIIDTGAIQHQKDEIEGEFIHM